MKRLFTSFLFMMAGAFMTTVLADSYNIWVGGVRVTDDNKDNISPAGKTSGTISYNSTYKNLIFQNVTMTTDKCCIDVEMEGVDVMFEGTNTFTSTGANTFYAKCPVILCDYGETSATDAGNPRVTFNCTAPESGYYSALWFRSDGTLDIWGLYLTCTSNYYAIQGPNDASLSATLYSSSSEIKAESKNSSVAAITRFSSAYSAGGKMADRVTYNKTNKRTEKADGSIANSVTWKNGIYVCGRMVNAQATSRRDVKHPNMTGTVYYLNKELILDGVTYNGSDRFVENYNVENLKITCKGTNKITTSMHAIVPRANTTITGTGSLSLTSTASSAISTYNGANVTVNIDMLEANGADYGFYGEQAGTLTLNKYSSNSVYKFMGGNCNLYMGKVVMDGMDIWTPNSYFNPKEYKMYYNGAVATTSNGPSTGTWFKSTNAFTYYPIYVAGTHVNDRNKDNVLSQYITGGNVIYDTGSKTLTLNGVQFEATGTDAPNGIYVGTGLDGLTINFTGAEQHWTTDKEVFDLSSTTTISGNCPRVYLTSNNQSGITTRYSASVTINTTGYLGSKGAKYGYYGNGATNELLTLSKTTEDTFGYNFEGEEGAIRSVMMLRLNNMDFAYIDGLDQLPGCYFDEANKQVSQNGGSAAKGKVTFMSIKEKLPIYVAGKQLNVTRSDCSIYVGSPYITSGPKSVKYVPSTKTLTLTDATTVDHGNNNAVTTCGIAVLDEGVTIDVVGNNNITAGNYGIWANKDLTIGGSGNLNIISTETGALGINDNANERTLTLQCSGGVHSFQGKSYGFRGWNTASLAIYKVGSGALYKFAGETADIGTTKALKLGDGVRLHSRYTWFNEEEKAMYRYAAVSQNSNIDDGTWIRGDVEWIDSPLYVCDHQLYGAYVDGNFKGPASGFSCKEYGGTGISYNPESQTLTLNGVKIESDDVSDAVKNEGVDDLTIKLTGESDIKVRDNVFQLCRNTTITGDGTLRGEATADDGYGVWLNGDEDPDLVLDGPTFEFKGQAAIGGQGDNNLSFNKGKLTFEPNDYPLSAFTALANVHFAANLAITEPEGAYYSKDLKNVTTDGEDTYRGLVVVDEVTPYDLTIAGVGVNSANFTDILHDGVFSYEPVGNTLTISGDCDYEYKTVESSIEDLTINVSGNSTLTAESGSFIIRLYANTTITGGKLTLKSEEASLGIYISDGGTLTIKDADIEVAGDGFYYGITGTADCSLIIDNSDISVSAHSYGCIYDWGAITLSNCYIEQPEASVIKADGIYGIDDFPIGSGGVTETLVIKAGEMTGIDELGVRNEELGVGNGQSIFDLQGRKVTNPEKGKIYILNGKKVKK